MTDYILHVSDNTKTIMRVAYSDYLTGMMKILHVLVDTCFVDALKLLGNFHPRVKQRPEDFSPVLRRRHPRLGGSREVRLPVAIITLANCNDRDQAPITLASDIGAFLDEASLTSRLTPKHPKNGNPLNCLIENWTIDNEVPEDIDLSVFDQIEGNRERAEVRVGNEIVRSPQLSPAEIQEYARKYNLKIPGVEVTPSVDADKPVDNIFKYINVKREQTKNEQPENTPSVPTTESTPKDNTKAQ